ncbi:MAG TPA: TetR/AcrR family transcriptional regulator [Longimicrobium sp.]|nr:TetR/AcrR family transcriptional regulator [Longimicrobium sp.]
MDVTERGASNDYRRRLMDGMAAAVAERGYADTTIADIVRQAHVSRRTFYEQFASKEACLLALYAAASDRVIRAIGEAVETSGDRETQIVRATEAYLARMAAHPVLTRTLFLEILAAGPAGLQVRSEMNARYASFFRGVVQANGGRLSPALAAAAVGGINELILQAVLDDRIDRLGELAAPASQLLRAVLAVEAGGEAR